MKKYLFLAISFCLIEFSFAQLPTPTDYLTPAFHKGRREALRAIMPANSVIAIFAYPLRNFSNDIDYKYHANPDLYYFTGYKEPDAMLLVFKEPQTGSDGKTYTELFFVQKNDPLREKWMGKRLGPAGVKTKLGIENAYNGSDFESFPIDLSAFSKVIFDVPKSVSDDGGSAAGVFGLVQQFKKKAAVPADFDEVVMTDLSYLVQHPELAHEVEGMKRYYNNKIKQSERFRNNALVNELANVQDSAAAAAVIKKIDQVKWDVSLFEKIIGALRQIKTPEEMVLLKKAINISCYAHNEAMKAVKPGMSEMELQGLQEYIHKKLGAEDVGYPSIVGAGSNGCVLHYMENNVTDIGKQMVLMDVGAEYHGYSADVTRTFPASGKYTAEQKLIYDLVYDAQEAVFKKCVEGTTFEEIENTAREVLTEGLMKLGILKKKEDIRQFYPHGCSHYLGLDVHDRGDYKVLKENMVITVEPGIYIPEGSDCDKKWWSIAVRIEDDVRIGKDKFELLSHLSPRKTTDVEKMIAEKSFTDGMTPYFK